MRPTSIAVKRGSGAQRRQNKSPGSNAPVAGDVCRLSVCQLLNSSGVCSLQVMRIVDNVRPDRQTVMFSATFPRSMEALARRILSKPIEVQVGGRSVVCSDVEQHVVSTGIKLLLKSIPPVLNSLE